jgi:hypothetical protein
MASPDRLIHGAVRSLALWMRGPVGPYPSVVGPRLRATAPVRVLVAIYGMEQPRPLGSNGARAGLRAEPTIASCNNTRAGHELDAATLTETRHARFKRGHMHLCASALSAMQPAPVKGHQPRKRPRRIAGTGEPETRHGDAEEGPRFFQAIGGTPLPLERPDTWRGQ